MLSPFFVCVYVLSSYTWYTWFLSASTVFFPNCALSPSLSLTFSPFVSLHPSQVCRTSLYIMILFTYILLNVSIHFSTQFPSIVRIKTVNACIWGRKSCFIPFITDVINCLYCVESLTSGILPLLMRHSSFSPTKDFTTITHTRVRIQSYTEQQQQQQKHESVCKQ